MIKAREITLEQSGVRLDAALFVAFPNSTKNFIREALERGEILIDGRRSQKGAKVKGGEKVQVIELLEVADNRVASAGICPKPIFEDETLLAFDKIAGMPVQPLSCRETGTLMNTVVTKHPECQGVGDDPLMAGAIHRIDADTSGLVMVARTNAAFENLRSQFSAQSVRKTYLALVEGAVAIGGTLENDLIHDPTLPFCRMIDLHHNRLTASAVAHCRPMHAITTFQPIAHTSVENEERTLLEVTIFTGVTHQIRAQLAMAGMHIVNDRLYGAFAVEEQVGHCLHALSAKFFHPLSGFETEIRTEYPHWANFQETSFTCNLTENRV